MSPFSARVKIKLKLLRRVPTRETQFLQNVCRVFTESKGITEKVVSRKNNYFLFSFCPLEANPFILGQILGYLSKWALTHGPLRGHLYPHPLPFS